MLRFTLPRTKKGIRANSASPEAVQRLPSMFEAAAGLLAMAVLAIVLLAEVLGVLVGAPVLLNWLN